MVGTTPKAAGEWKDHQVYANRGAAKLRLFADANPVADEPVAEAQVPADKKPHAIQLASPLAGLHLPEVADGG